MGRDVSISDLQRDFDAVYVGSGIDSRNQIGLALNSEGEVSGEPETLETSSVREYLPPEVS